MSGLLITILVLVLGIFPAAGVIAWYYMKNKAVFSISVIAIALGLLLFITGYSVASYGMLHLLWGVPLTIAATVFLFSYLKRSIVLPLNENKSLIAKMSDIGVLDHKDESSLKKNANTLGGLSLALKEFNSKQKNTLDILNKVSNYELNIDTGILGEDNVFAKALEDMKNKLSEAKEMDRLRQIEEEQRNWASEGISKFSDIWHKQNIRIADICYSFMSSLVDYIGVTQGAIFVIEDTDKIDDVDSEEIVYEMLGAVAYEREKNISLKFKTGEGLVGRAAFERLPIYMKEVPGDYVNVTSGLGDSNPKSILLVPAIFNEKVFGVIELASIKEIEDYKIKFVESLGEMVASSISSIKVNEKTRILLENSKQQGEELAAQEEEMRQNLEELQATQEEMSRLRGDEQRRIETLEARIQELESQAGTN